MAGLSERDFFRSTLLVFGVAKSGNFATLRYHD